MTVSRAYLESCRGVRGENFVKAAIAAGKWTGEIMEIDSRLWFRLVAIHRPGLGDRVAAVAQPIARALDAVLGTKIQECGGCKRRREALNRAFPGS